MMALTGELAVSVFPKNISVPLLKGLVFESFVVFWIRHGTDLLPIAKSLKDKWIVGSYCDNPGDVNSLHQRNPKCHIASCLHHSAMIIPWLDCNDCLDLPHDCNSDKKVHCWLVVDLLFLDSFKYLLVA